MARYTGPKSRIARKFGEGIFGADKVLSKKNYPPGQHGNSRSMILLLNLDISKNLSDGCIGKIKHISIILSRYKFF